MFDIEGFMDYIRNNYTWEKSTQDIIENIAQYAMERQTSKDQVVNFITDLADELEFGEVAQFCPDSMLTSYGLAEKKEWIQENSPVSNNN